MRPLSRPLFLAGIAASIAATPAHATESFALHWQCEQRFDAGFHVECKPQVQEERGAAEPSAAVSPRQAAEQRYVPVAMRPVEQINAFAIWRVPLHGVPINRTDTEYLLHAVLCGRNAGCAVRYESGRNAVVQRAPHPFIR